MSAAKTVGSRSIRELFPFVSRTVRCIGTTARGLSVIRPAAVAVTAVQVRLAEAAHRADLHRDPRRGAAVVVQPRPLHHRFPRPAAQPAAADQVAGAASVHH